MAGRDRETIHACVKKIKVSLFVFFLFFFFGFPYLWILTE